MSSSETKSQNSLGFLTVVDNGDAGCVGGYLILNMGGRPLEFHCTAPVRANRAQQILYGESLTPFVYGELIARALIDKAAIKPTVVFADQSETLCVQGLTQLPVVLLAERSAGTLRQTARHQFEVEGFKLELAMQFEAQSETLSRYVRRFVETIELDEPFSRIRDAIDEAQRGARAA